MKRLGRPAREESREPDRRGLDGLPGGGGSDPSDEEGGSGPIAVGVPLGDVIPRNFVDDPHLVVLHEPTALVTERFRRLRLRIERIETAEAPCRVLVVTSATPEEGKTTTSINLALAWAEEKNQRVLLVDGDLRRPAVSDYVHPKAQLGFSDVLRERAPLEHTLLKLRNSTVTVLPSGPAMSNPLPALQSDALAKAIGELRGRFDRIVIDSPPTVPFTDAAILQGRADGALLVVRAGKATRPLIERAVESLSGGRLVGVVMNDVHQTPVDRYYYRYDQYGYYEDYPTRSPEEGRK